MGHYEITALPHAWSEKRTSGKKLVMKCTTPTRTDQCYRQLVLLGPAQLRGGNSHRVPHLVVGQLEYHGQVQLCQLG